MKVHFTLFWLISDAAKPDFCTKTGMVGQYSSQSFSFDCSPLKFTQIFQQNKAEKVLVRIFKN
jgi:hypothetical protein